MSPRTSPRIGRRPLLLGLGALLAISWLPARGAPPANRDGTLDGSDFGLAPGSAVDQSAALQQAVTTAARLGQPLALRGGSYRVGNVALPSGITLTGTAGGARLLAAGPTPILHAEGQQAITLSGLELDGSGGGPTDNRAGLVLLTRCESIRLEALNVHGGPSNGAYLEGCSGIVTGTSFSGHGVAGIFANNSHDLVLSQNRVADCGNAGILVWQDASGPDGTIVSGNHVSRIAAHDGGNGENGNGINIFRADNVVVVDNVVDGCDFSAVRANTARNVQIRGNTCSNLKEVAIYAEFAFSGAVIASNVVDGAAAGISITNFKQGGQFAVCSGNIVRNITPNSATNPDVTPYGIYAEAETTIIGNTVQSVPGIGIAAGYGAYLKDVLIADNVVTGTDTGIGVSVAEGAGAVRIAGNMISDARIHAIVGMKWNDVASADLVADAPQFPNVTIEGNIVTP